MLTFSSKAVIKDPPSSETASTIYNLGLTPCLEQDQNFFVGFSKDFSQSATVPEYMLEVGQPLSVIGSRPHITLAQFSSNQDFPLEPLWEKINHAFQESFKDQVTVALKGTRAKKDGLKLWAQVQVDRNNLTCSLLQEKFTALILEHGQKFQLNFHILNKTGAQYDPHLTFFYGSADKFLEQIMTSNNLVFDNFMGLFFNKPEPDLQMPFSLTLAKSGPAFQMQDPLYAIRERQTQNPLGHALEKPRAFS